MIYYPLNLEIQFFNEYKKVFKKIISDIKKLYEIKRDDEVIMTQNQIETIINNEFKGLQNIYGYYFYEVSKFTKKGFYRKILDVVKTDRKLRNKYTIEALNVVLKEPETANLLERFYYTNNIYNTQVKEELLQKTLSLSIQAVEQGKSMKTLSKELQEIYSWSEKKASLHAQTQISNLYGILERERYTKNGFKRYIWSTSKDGRVRPSHKALEGQVRNFGDIPEPNQEFRCRCTRLPVFEDVLDLI